MNYSSTFTGVNELNSMFLALKETCFHDLSGLFPMASVLAAERPFESHLKCHQFIFFS